MEILVERNQIVTLYFPMIKVGVQDFAQSGDWTPVAADTQYSVDGGAFSNTNATPSNEGGGIWSLVTTAAEVNGKRTVFKVEDAATKAVEDQAIIVQTWGDDSAGIPFNAIADYVLRRGFQAMIDSSRGDTKGLRSLAGAVAKLVNKLAIAGGTLTVYEDDDTTALGTQAVTTNASADPIEELDTV